MKLTLIAFFSVILSVGVKAQKNDKLKVFIDCDCDQTFIKQKLTYLSYVRDRLLADVHVMLVEQPNASGGTKNTFSFFGQGDFKSHSDTLEVDIDVNMTEDEIRRKQSKLIEIGLMSYLVKKGMFDKVDVSVEKPEELVLEEDPWKNWVFSTYAGGWFNGEEQYHNAWMNANFEFSKVTEDLKIEGGLGLNQNKQAFLIEEEWMRSQSNNKWAYLNYIKSMNDHWSWGLFNSHNSSIYMNHDYNVSLKAGIEYNLFPYSESAERQLRCSYRIGGIYNDYIDTTVFYKTEEFLMEQSAGIAYAVNQKWGNLNLSVQARNYLHDFRLNAIQFDARCNLRLFKGFSWNFSTGLDLIHNQVSLSGEGLSETDAYTRIKALQTRYRYRINTGINYTFGSVYNSVVNPRFG